MCLRLRALFFLIALKKSPESYLSHRVFCFTVLVLEYSFDHSSDLSFRMTFSRLTSCVSPDLNWSLLEYYLLSYFAVVYYRKRNQKRAVIGSIFPSKSYKWSKEISNVGFTRTPSLSPNKRRFIYTSHTY